MYFKIFNFFFFYGILNNLKFYYTALINAAKNGHKEVVKQLLLYPEIDISIKDIKNQKVLMILKKNFFLYDILKYQLMEFLYKIIYKTAFDWANELKFSEIVEFLTIAEKTLNKLKESKSENHQLIPT